MALVIITIQDAADLEVDSGSVEVDALFEPRIKAGKGATLTRAQQLAARILLELGGMVDA